jgi:hypothetical protein
LAIVDTLEATWRGIHVRTDLHGPTYANRTLYADLPFAQELRELMGADLLGSRPMVRAQIRRVVDYSAKLGRQGAAHDDVDLFTVLPTYRSAPSRRACRPEPIWPLMRQGAAAAISRKAASRSPYSSWI